jgi:uncharacterized repeat protein (TIGR01451 family)
MKKLFTLLALALISFGLRAQITYSPGYLSFTTGIGDTSLPALFSVNTTVFGVDSPSFTVTAPHGYRVSFDGVTWDSSISTSIDTGITLGIEVYVEFLPVDSGCYANALLMSVQTLPVKYFPLWGDGVPPYILYHAADSFSVVINDFCSGPQITVATNYFVAGQNVINYYGDGKSDTLPLTPEVVNAAGYAVFNHVYAMPGTYSMKTIICDGLTPVDSQTYSFESVLCNTIKAKYYYDANNNGQYDPTTDPLVTLPMLTEVDSNGIAIDTVCSTSGIYFSAHGVSGDVYALKNITTSTMYLNSNPATGMVYDTLSVVNYDTATHYFGLKCNPSAINDLIVNDVVPVTGVHDQWGNIYVQNLGSCGLTDVVVTEAVSPKYNSSINGGGPASYAISGNMITWTIPNFTSTSGIASLYHVGWASPDIPIGDTVLCNSKITPYAGDCDTLNNAEMVIDTVRAGCDPNEMWVSPQGCFPATTGTTQLQYTLSFVNTGNGPAVNIYILDTLSPNLDLSTMRIVLASHTMNFFHTKDAAGNNIVKFDFPNINLLDSSHHDSCSGAVIFTVNTKPDLALNTTIANEAGIYFDINPVVMTNQVVNTVGCPSSVPMVAENHEITLYPNPATQECLIKTSGSTYKMLTVTNMVGEVVLQRPLTSGELLLDISPLATGVYFVTATGDGVKAVEHLVKL